tara:strand:- start:1429 stop:1881 length:453 start_codon:yes stop_codon:yes gene_type:complete
LESKKEKMDTRDAMPWATLDRAGEGYEDAVKDEPLSDEPIEKRTLKELVLMHQKATLEAFGKDNWIMSRPPMHERSAKMKMSIKVRPPPRVIQPPPAITHPKRTVQRSKPNWFVPRFPHADPRRVPGGAQHAPARDPAVEEEEEARRRGG